MIKLGMLPENIAQLIGLAISEVGELKEKRQRSIEKSLTEQI